jgi:hypothetical protein
MRPGFPLEVGGTSSIGGVGAPFGVVLGLALALCFITGLLSRVVLWLKAGGSGRKRSKDRMALQQQRAPREIAADVPVHRRIRRPRMPSGRPTPTRGS